jgi:hypothetical protein
MGGKLQIPIGIWHLPNVAIAQRIKTLIGVGWANYDRIGHLSQGIQTKHQSTKKYSCFHVEIISVQR